MAYGFDENKNKVEMYPASEVYTKDEVYSKNESYSKDEVYSKDDFVVISETVTDIQQGSLEYYKGFLKLSASVLLSKYNISDLRNYMVVSINTCENDDDWYCDSVHPKPTQQGSIYPNAWCDSNDGNSLKINVFSNTGANIRVRILLLKVA